MDTQKVGRRIQEVRKARGITQMELAQMHDLSTKYISNIECGFKTPKLNTFVAIANALQCDANTLLSDVLDTTTGQESALVSRKMLALPIEEQRRLLRVLEIMIDETRAKRSLQFPPTQKRGGSFFAFLGTNLQGFVSQWRISISYRNTSVK